ncbi:MAG: chromosomal replication initiator DnaA, partial [Candidatus Firestonebacteria bacterium]|nr:chromosomal replication initiator DnaA [Candidatus Firestonebacteria bacterium]
MPETKITGTHTEEEIIKKISDKLGIEKGEIFYKRKGNINRQIALYLIKRYTGYKLERIGKIFDMDYSAV